MATAKKSGSKKTAVVICPGRGTYGKSELGYLARHHGDMGDFLAMADAYRRDQGQEAITALDGATSYSPATHGGGDNASPLIYACSFADFMAIDRDAFEIVAVTGNSLGWYSALACGGAATPSDALHIINTMGRLMHEEGPGGQLLYPLVDKNWQAIPGRRAELLELIAFFNSRKSHDLHCSIDLGGFLVFAGNETALTALMKILPKEQDRFPMVLAKHAAFHSPLMAPIARRARELLPPSLLRQPHLPLIDGRGAVWYPHGTDVDRLWHYTLGTQITETYDFSTAVQVAAKEFAPDCMIVLGPGTTLGGSVAQSLIPIAWRGITSKSQFSDQQRAAPFLLSLGLPAQRGEVTGESALEKA